MRRVALCGAALVLGIGLIGCNSATDSSAARDPGNPPAPSPSPAVADSSSTEVVLSVPGMH